MSGWTTDTLKAHFDDLRDTDKVDVDRRFRAAEVAVAAALASAEKAGDKADAATEKRFDGVNEFRDQLRDQAGTFLSRVEYLAGHQALVDRLEALTNRVERWDGHGAGITDATKVIYAVIGLVVVIAAAVIGHVYR